MFIVSPLHITLKINISLQYDLDSIKGICFRKNKKWYATLFLLG